MSTPGVGLSPPGGGPSVEALQARLAELEEQLKARTRSAPKPVLVGALAGTALITTPLAVLTVRRWWHWWND